MFWGSLASPGSRAAFPAGVPADPKARFHLLKGVKHGVKSSVRDREMWQGHGGAQLTPGTCRQTDRQTDPFTPSERPPGEAFAHPLPCRQRGHVSR